LGFYHHKTFHSNLYFLFERQLRRQYSRGFFLESALGLGYSRTFLSGTTYKVENNVVSIKKWAGYNYAMISISGGLGFDFSKKSKRPLKTFIKPSLFVLTPYNSYLYLRPTIELGIIYSPANLIKDNIKVKIKKK
jgi:hypothetical protein